MHQILHPHFGPVSVFRKIYFDRHTEGISSSHQTESLNSGMPKIKVVYTVVSVPPVNRENSDIIPVYKVFLSSIKPTFKLKKKAMDKK